MRPLLRSKQRLTTLAVDGVTVVKEQIAVRNFKNGKKIFTDTKAQVYDAVRVVFDIYTKVCTLKETTRERRRGKLKEIRSY